MRVHLIRLQTMEKFKISDPQSERSVNDWLTKLKNADWQIPSDIKDTYNTADLLGNGTNRVIFNLAGNHYRMICKYAFGNRQVHLYICWLGTHAAYNKLCKILKQYSINNY